MVLLREQDLNVMGVMIVASRMVQGFERGEYELSFLQFRGKGYSCFCVNFGDSSNIFFGGCFEYLRDGPHTDRNWQ